MPRAGINGNTFTLTNLYAQAVDPISFIRLYGQRTPIPTVRFRNNAVNQAVTLASDGDGPSRRIPSPLIMTDAGGGDTAELQCYLAATQMLSRHQRRARRWPMTRPSGKKFVFIFPP